MDTRTLAARRPKSTALQLVALLGVFWVAQLHGLAHGIGHLGRDQAAPHAVVCTDCIASADASAAPPLASTAPTFAAPTEAASAHPAAAHGDRQYAASYRSRAPPSNPV